MRRALAVLIPILLAAPAPARAEIAPEHYAGWQRNAPEALTIRVLEVETSICWFGLCETRDVRVTAKVTAVTRSASGLEPGRRIEIRYVHFSPRENIAGPRPIPLLREGDVVPAWLAKAGKSAWFEPAARGASFEPEIPLPEESPENPMRPASPPAPAPNPDTP
jgi:hypothetical protein